MNKPKQLDCELNCKATAELNADLVKDFKVADKSLASLLKEKDEDESKDTTGASD